MKLPAKLWSFTKEYIISHGFQLPVRILVTLDRWRNEYSYMGQAEQDRIILEILQNKFNGTFVELGSSNGVTSSNTYVLEKKFRWTGICIEPNKRFFKELVKNRKCVKVNSLIAGEETTLRFNNDGATGAISEDGEEMHAVPLSKVLDEYHMPYIIDYLSLDVEGYEEKVLLGFPFQKYRFRVMTIERPSDNLHNKLISFGYELHSKIGEGENWLDNIYVDRELL